ncbi:hypothetical protein ROD_20781 [Citrobacter rodentium ICC168]|uniref:Uncharacterized protein n=1 Tax=Citrobacter rodentium (strain ICC168) TaxID=637910 RepID=D2TPL2_CITRI|nr:hypothetical protein ROD_20781 [Citrobacter rodentium ICC168]
MPLVGAPFSHRTVKPPIRPPKTMDIKKPGNPSQENRVKIISFFDSFRTRKDVPKLKSGSSDWDRLSH